MKRIPRTSVHRFFVVGVLSVTLATNLAPGIYGQKRSREELLKEAARLVTQAERATGETYQKAGADRKLIRESEKLTAENFEKAIELWREAGDDKRLIAGVEELTRLYSVLGEYDKVLTRLTSEADYWLTRGNIAEHVDALYTLGVRQGQMQRNATAIETLERVLELSRLAQLRSLEPNVLNNLAMLYEKAGRSKDAQAANEKARELWSKSFNEPRRPPDPIPPATIPAQWIDLPGAPAAAEYRVVDGVNQAVLANRSAKGIEMVMFGCVALEENNKVRVLYGLIGRGLNHGGVRPGYYYSPFTSLNGPLNRWTDEKMGCEGAAKMTLIEARFDDRSIWKADDVYWQPSPPDNRW